MKIYRFDPKTGAYMGEDFADEVPIIREVSALPYDATTIALPEVGGG